MTKVSWKAYQENKDVNGTVGTWMYWPEDFKKHQRKAMSFKESKAAGKTPPEKSVQKAVWFENEADFVAKLQPHLRTDIVFIGLNFGFQVRAGGDQNKWLSDLASRGYFANMYGDMYPAYGELMRNNGLLGCYATDFYKIDPDHNPATGRALLGMPTPDGTKLTTRQKSQDSIKKQVAYLKEELGMLGITHPIFVFLGSQLADLRCDDVYSPDDVGYEFYHVSGRKRSRRTKLILDALLEAFPAPAGHPILPNDRFFMVPHYTCGAYARPSRYSQKSVIPKIAELTQAQ